MDLAAKLYHSIYPGTNFYSKSPLIQYRFREAIQTIKTDMSEEFRKEWFTS